MLRLLWKELRQLAPIGWLWLAVIAIGYTAQLLGSRVDEETFGSWYEEVAAVGSNPTLAAISALFAIVTAWALFPREHDESTIDFLRSLPVSRLSVFLAKVCAGWLVLSAVTLLAYGIDAATLASNPESIGGRFYPQAFLSFLWRDLVFAFVVISHGVLLSWFRVTGLVVYALYLLIVMWLESATGSAGLFSVLRLLSNEYDGSRLVVDNQAILVHVGVACLCLTIGYRLWSRTESVASGGRARRRGGAWLRAGALVAAFAFVGAGMLYQVGQGSGALVDESLEVVNTRYFRFVFSPAKRETVDYVLEHADADFETLGRLLGAAKIPNVRVNLAAASEHAAGLATWKTIRMDLDTFEDDRSQRRVLSHEAAHVMQSVLSERALARHFGAARFFVEGMAQYTSFLIVPEPGRRASNWAIAAVAWERQDIRFENLIDAGFAERFDPDLYYSLGDLWTTSFVEVCGEPALGGFLRAAGRDDVPRSLAPQIFWRDTLAAIDCELESINADWQVRMQALFDETDRSRFPRFADTSVVRLDDGRVRIGARLLADAKGAAEPDARNGASDDVSADQDTLPSRFVVRVGAGAALVAAVDPVFRGRVENDGADIRVVFEVPAQAIPRRRFEYQLGYAPYDDSRVWYDTRRNGSAAPLSAR